MEKKIDIVVLGATGYTGKYVVRELFLNAPKDVFWAICGRNIDKLNNVLASLSQDSKSINVPVIQAECNNLQSLDEMAKKCKLVINCIGPFRFYGENVVKACINNGTHYVDITGEPEFMENMQLKYHDEAKNNGCYIVSSCGLDSIPADIGVLHLIKNFDGQLNFVESYMQISSNSNRFVPICNVATWESAVYGYANVNNLMNIRKKLFSQYKKPKLSPSIPRRPNVHRSEVFENKYSVVFPGADRSVVQRTQMFLHKEYNMRPVQYNAYMVCDSKFVLAGLAIIRFYLETLSGYRFGRWLLLKFPRFFTLGMMSAHGPSEQEAENTTGRYKFFGKGWSTALIKSHDDMHNKEQDLTITTELIIQNPAYRFTSIAAILCALTILKEENKMPSGGGVHTPGSAFYRTSLIERLADNGVKFKILNYTGGVTPIICIWYYKSLSFEIVKSPISR